MGRVSCGRPMAFGLALICLCFLIHFQAAESTEYTVGDSAGWNFYSIDWPNGKSFKAGDVLVFKYNPAAHSVVMVDAGSYDSCTVPAGAKIYNSGNDRFTLANGKQYFICGVPGHCQSDMKIAVDAA